LLAAIGVYSSGRDLGYMPVAGTAAELCRVGAIAYRRERSRNPSRGPQSPEKTRIPQGFSPEGFHS